MILNPATQRIIETLNQDLPQALLLSGPDGIGFAGVVELLAKDRQVIMLQPEKDDQIDLKKGSITIEMIRDLYDLLKTRTDRARLIVLRDADTMGIPAQNAFLKLLEEPGDGINFVLLSHKPNQLLPTIRSRVQKIEVKPVPKQASEALLDELGVKDPTKRTQLLFIAEGLPALLTELANDETAFQSRAQIIRDARSLLTERTYEKLKIAESYKDRREDTLTLLTDMAKLLKRSPDSLQQIDKILQIYERIAANGNIRLQLASLVV